MDMRFNDGGRAAAGFIGSTGDCAVRSAAIVTGLPYKEVYDAINLLAKKERPRKHKRSNARLGVSRHTFDKYLASLGWVWIPTMKIGTGTQVHLRAEELPKGRIICYCSRHFTAVIDGVINDTYNPDRDGTRAVYGYWHKPAEVD